MSEKLKITSWNINGIKTLSPPFKDILDNFDSDIICFQETKTNEDTLTYKCAVVEGYNSYFSFCKTKPGYSGVCIYCRNPIVPISAEEGFVSIIKKINRTLTDDVSIRERLNLSVEELQSLETEGRAICCEFSIKDCECGNTDRDHSIFLINVYCPMTDSDNIERIKYKTQFNELLQLCIDSILSSGSHLLLIGDLNIKHKSIDIAELMPEEEFLTNCHRQWFDSLLIESQRCPKISSRRPSSLNVFGRLVDTFRWLYPSLADQYSCFVTKIGPRITNVGTRIDYIICDSSLLTARCLVSESAILRHVTGSDHCPVTSTLQHLRLSSAANPPSLCTSNLAKFRNQSRITSFFSPTQTLPRKRSSLEHGESLSPKHPKQSVKASTSSANAEINAQWKNILKSPERCPRCSEHKLPCVLRTVTKDGANKGRKYWCCSKPSRIPNSPEAKCNYFLWSTE